MQNRASQIKNTNEKITSEVGELEKMKFSSLKVQTQKSQEFKSFRQTNRGQKRTISQLSQKEKEFRSQLNAKRREVERLNNEIESIHQLVLDDDRLDGASERAGAAASAGGDDEFDRLVHRPSNACCP